MSYTIPVSEALKGSGRCDIKLSRYELGWDFLNSPLIVEGVPHFVDSTVIEPKTWLCIDHVFMS